MRSGRTVARNLWLPLLFTLTALAAPPSKSLTPLDVAKMRQVVEAKISPDARWVAYTLSVPRIPGKDEDGTPWQELHLVDLAANQQRAFITGEVSVGAIDWMPDSSGICYLSKREGDKTRALHFIPVDGGESRRLLALDADISAFSLSPDGDRVAVLSTEPQEDRAKQLEKWGFKQTIFEEDWRKRRIHVAALKGDPAPRELLVEGTPYRISWSPVAGRLAVSVAPTPLSDDSYMHQRVQVIDVDSGNVLGRIQNPGKLGPFEWSPDGNRLALISGADLNDPAAGRLMIVEASGGVPRDLVPQHPGDFDAIDWVSDSDIAVVNSRGVWSDCRIVSVADGKLRNWGSEKGPVFTSIDLSRDGDVAVLVGSSPTFPPEAFLLRAGADPVRLTLSNPWLDEVPLAPQEVVRFKARDGLDLEGVLIRPLNEEKGKKYPLILSVHGGPEAHESNGWLTSYSRLGQMAAALDMAVFFPNYRGSTGRGVEFSKSSQGDPAGKEFDDLVDAAEHLISTGLADRSKVGITGGSYGGYATGWCSTYYSDHFAAGVMFVGISDKVSKVGTTDIPEEEYLVHARKHVWEDWDFFLKRSPIYYADRGRTPLLILHGTDDPRVNPGQSRELYRHLKERGKAPVRLVFYPGEEHGNRKAAARFDYSLRALRWFDHYLKGPGGTPPDYHLDYGLSAGSTVDDAAAEGVSTFADDLKLLQGKVETVVLQDPVSGAKVAVVPAWQGRVMTSTFGGTEIRSLGWINRGLIESGQLQPHINAFGGEDRFWIGPEGGQFGIFFPPGVPFDFGHWQTPPALDTEPFELVRKDAVSAEFARTVSITNYSGTPFYLGINRKIRLLDRDRVESLLGIPVDGQLKMVAFESVNEVRNNGSRPWEVESGLLSVWILGMYPPSPSTTVIVPFQGKVTDASLGVAVNDDYFGKVPADRLIVRDGVAFFRADGLYRSKIGFSPARAKPVLGSWDREHRVLTLVQYERPSGPARYVNSKWEMQADPYSGDVVNSYNDGPPGPGLKPMGPFYELETSSPGAELGAGERLVHTHRTIHLTGDPELLAAIASKVLGIDLKECPW